MAVQTLYKAYTVSHALTPWTNLLQYVKAHGLKKRKLLLKVLQCQKSNGQRVGFFT